MNAFAAILVGPWYCTVLQQVLLLWRWDENYSEEGERGSVADELELVLELELDAGVNERESEREFSCDPATMMSCELLDPVRASCSGAARNAASTRGRSAPSSDLKRPRKVAEC